MFFTSHEVTYMNKLWYWLCIDCIEINRSYCL